MQWTDEKGYLYIGSVEHCKRGWVLINLDSEKDTGQGWKARRLMIKTSTPRLIPEMAVKP